MGWNNKYRVIFVDFLQQMLIKKKKEWWHIPVTTRLRRLE